MTIYDVGNNCSIELTTFDPPSDSLTVLTFKTPHDTIRFALDEDTVRELGEDLIDRAESIRLSQNPHVVERVREALASDPADDVEVDLDEVDPAILKEWRTTPDCDLDYVVVDFAPSVNPSGDPDQTTYISVHGGAAYLTAEDAQGLIDRLQAHITAHSKREKRERSKNRNEWAAALYPSLGSYEELTWTHKKIVDRAIENHNALIGKDD